MPTGEALPPELARRWLQHYPAIPLVNAYGPAECSDDVALHRLDSPPGEAALVPVGRATDHNRLFVLEEELGLLPEGAAGELWVAGIGVARGYLGDPARTAERFVPDPFAADGGRLYRTGDRARWNREGLLECMGRVDRQLKLRGQRIEPGEIEARLLEQPEVREAAVALDATGSQLTAWIVTTTPDPDLPARLRAQLRRQLPEHMVPARIHTLPILPRTRNGKLDTQALPQDETPRTRIPPRTDTERTLHVIWQDVLGHPDIGVTDDFFQLGGHSLLITQVFSRVRRELQTPLSLRELFEAATIEELASRIDQVPRATITRAKAARLGDLMAQLEAM